MIKVLKCSKCQKVLQIWVNDEMILPKITKVPEPNEYMPENVKNIYNEAKSIFNFSPRASAALLRLALQYLCIELGGEGKSINADIANLVKNGLPTEVQQALDIIRVTGNEAVHPGVITFEDNEEITLILFDLINFIVKRMIVEPKVLNDMFDDVFDKLPKDKLDGIKNIDHKK